MEKAGQSRSTSDQTLPAGTLMTSHRSSPHTTPGADHNTSSSDVTERTDSVVTSGDGDVDGDDEDDDDEDSTDYMER